MTVEREILTGYTTVAMVGLSANPERPSNEVASYLKKNGYRIIPVNPNEKVILDETSYPDIVSIPEQVEVVDIFRKSEDVPPIVQEAVKIGARAVWMQEGVINQEAAKYAADAGLKVVMDKCMKKQHEKMQSEK